MNMEWASVLIDSPQLENLSLHGIGQTAYYQRTAGGFTFGELIEALAETEAEVWEIAEGWATAAGLDRAPVIEDLRMFTDGEWELRQASDREDWVGE